MSVSSIGRSATMLCRGLCRLEPCLMVGLRHIKHEFQEESVKNYPQAQFHTRSYSSRPDVLTSQWPSPGELVFLHTWTFLMRFFSLER